MNGLWLVGVFVAGFWVGVVLGVRLNSTKPDQRRWNRP